jgi:GT2 family glycosyltransferase
VGLLDEDYFFGGELADLCARARQHGFGSAVDERARAYHCVRRSSGLRQSLHIYYVLRNRFLYIRKFHHGERFLLFPRWVAYGTYLALLSLAHRRFQRTRSILLGLLDGLQGRYGGQNERVLRTALKGQEYR